jgi:hypothetical protein
MAAPNASEDHSVSGIQFCSTVWHVDRPTLLTMQLILKIDSGDKSHAAAPAPTIHRQLI